MQGIHNRHTPHIRHIPIRNTYDPVQYLVDISKLFGHVMLLGCFKFGTVVCLRVSLVLAFWQAIFAGIPSDRWQVRISVGVGGRKRSNAAVFRNSVMLGSTM